MLGHIAGICESGQPSGLTCPNGRTLYSSVIWGLVGPRRLYSVGQIYTPLLHFFWIGALIPLVTFLLYRYTRCRFWKLINWPLIFIGTANVPPGIHTIPQTYEPTFANFNVQRLVSIILAGPSLIISSTASSNDATSPGGRNTTTS